MRQRRRGIGLWLTVATVLGSCAAPVPSPSLPATMEVVVDPNYVVTIVDDTGWITAADAARTPPSNVDAVHLTIVNPDNAPDSLYVGWLSQPCQTRPTLLARESQGRLALELYQGTVPDTACTLDGIPHAIVLLLDRDVVASDVAGSIKQGIPP